MLAIAEVERLAKEAEGSDLDSVPPDESWKRIAAFLGVPVEFDTAPHTRRPWATWLLGTVIIAASLFAFTRLHEMVTEFGLIPAEATRLHGLTFVTSFFLHAGIIHLVGNMYFLLSLATTSKIFSDRFVISCSSRWRRSLVISRISLSILAHKRHASARAAALLA